MSFETDLLDALGQATDAYDIQVAVRRCFFYDFLGNPVRLWDGEGVLTAGGFDWLGTIAADGVNYHSAPEVQDSRDGTSPRYTFKIPFLDRDTFMAMKADQGLARGRGMTCYHAIVQRNEGLRPAQSLRFNYRLTMQGTDFAESVDGDPGNTVRTYSAAVLCRSGESGRSRLPAGTYTDTAQKYRAALLGFPVDNGCSMVAANARRTFIVGSE